MGGPAPGTQPDQSISQTLRFLPQAHPENIRTGECGLVLFDSQRNHLFRDTKKYPLEGFEIHLNHLNLVSHLQLLEAFPGLFGRLAG